jgi:hypothetical protein
MASEFRCRRCGDRIEWLDPGGVGSAGGWWAHEHHPADEHDAEPPIDVSACDHCGALVYPDRNGWWVGADATSDCPASDAGHEVDGSARA